MLGLVRAILALMVMVFHLYVQIGPLGSFSVFGFYIISGYLMTMVMQESYGYTTVGKLAFARNRFLRLYPSYWVAAGLSLLLIGWVGADFAQRYHPSLAVPTSASAVVWNLSMVFPAWRPEQVDPRLVPPAWALTLELFFYALICLGLSRNASRVRWWFLLSVGFVAGSYMLGLRPGDRYFTVAAASLPFSVGAALYFARADGRCARALDRLRLHALSAFVLLAANIGLCCWLTVIKADPWLIDVGFYVNIILMAALLMRLKQGAAVLRLSPRMDKRIGDFSYPIYLLHWQCGLLMAYLLHGAVPEPRTGASLWVLSTALVVVCVISVLIIRCVDAPIHRLRSNHRNPDAADRQSVVLHR